MASTALDQVQLGEIGRYQRKTTGYQTAHESGHGSIHIW